MVGLASLAYPIAIFMSYKGQKIPRKPLIQSSTSVPLSVSKLTKRKNHLRPKILKTLTKPYQIPLSPPAPEDPVAPIELIEPNIEFGSEPSSEKLDSSFYEESGVLVESNESYEGEVQVVATSEGKDFVGFRGLSSGLIVRTIVSVVGLFVLQSVVTAWMMGSGDSGGKVEVEMRKGEVGLNGNNGFDGNSAALNLNVMEMEAKIAEIRKMAREARELERKNQLENGDEEEDDVSEGEEGEEELKVDNSKVQNGIVKEVDVGLSKPRERSQASLLNVKVVSGAVTPMKKGNGKGKDAKQKDDLLMFEKKHRYRSHLKTARDKPKGFHVMQTGAIDGAGSSNEFQERSNTGLKRNDEQLRSQSPSPGQDSRKTTGSNSGMREMIKETNGSAKPGSNSAEKKIDKRTYRDAEPERGVLQDYGYLTDDRASLEDSSNIATQKSRGEVNDQASTITTHATSSRKGQPTANKLGSKLTMSSEQQNGNPDTWWFSLPCVHVIRLQKGFDAEAQRGYYKVRIHSDANTHTHTPYIVAFENRGDAMNFSYLLDIAFEDLPDATIDVVPLSGKELKQVSESRNNRVVIVKKGELQLYAGQPLGDVESALTSLVVNKGRSTPS